MTSSPGSTPVVNPHDGSLEKGARWSHGGLTLVGLSLSGVRTSIAMPELKLCFDLAMGLPYAMFMKRFFITHGHMDHAGGIPYVIAQRNITSDPHTLFYMPKSLVAPMKNIIHQWEEIEDYKYANHEITGIDEHSVIELGGSFFVRPFKTVHRVESFGYTLWERRKKLKSDFLKASREEILIAKAQGNQVNEFIDSPLLSFTGDTQIDFLDVSPQVKKSKVLVCETTYFNDRKSIAHARTWGHTHLDELIPRLDEIEAEKIVLIHGSSRYGMREMLNELERKIPPQHRERVCVFPGR